MNENPEYGEWGPLRGIAASDVDSSAMKRIDAKTIAIAYQYGGCEINYLEIGGIGELVDELDETGAIKDAINDIGSCWTIILSTDKGRVYLDCDETISSTFTGPEVVSSEYYSTEDMDDIPEDIVEALNIGGIEC